MLRYWPVCYKSESLYEELSEKGFLIGFRNPPLDDGCSILKGKYTVSRDVFLLFRRQFIALFRFKQIVKLLFVVLHIRLFSNLI
jgi:hypothetical protein